MTRIVRTRLLACVLVGGLLGTLGGCSKKADVETPPPAAPRASSAATPSQTPTAAPGPTTDPLTGGSKIEAGVLAVKIDNVAAARPQVGLGQADIVVAERVEGNLTRMIGIFHTTFPNRVGPVRSARNTDLQYLPMFGKPGLVFSGANSKVLAQVKKASVVPIERSDRDHSRVAPHNVIVNLSKLAKLHKLAPPNQIGMTFAKQAPRWSQAAKQSHFKIKIGHDTFSFGYRGGDYSTSWNGRTNNDADSGTAVRTSNVLVLNVKTHRDHNTTSHLSDVSETVGKGKVTIYRDGRKLTGSWQRDSLAGPMRFVDAQGKDIALKPGKSWILLHG